MAAVAAINGSVRLGHYEQAATTIASSPNREPHLQKCNPHRLAVSGTISLFLLYDFVQSLGRGIPLLCWDDVRLLLAVASQGSYARAAKLEGVSLATIGRRLRALEQSLNVVLIERRPDGHRLAAQAEALLPAATRMAAAAGDLHANAGAGHAEIRVLAREWEALFLIRLLPALRLMLPHIQISVGYKHWPDL